MHPGIDKDKVKKEKEECHSELNNIKGIICRQLTTGIYIEPTNAFLAKIRERKNLENEIAQLTGVQAPYRENEAIYEVTKENMFKDFKN